MKTYNWSELTSVEEKIVVNNLLSRALNLRKYAPKTYKELKQGYLDNADRIDKVLKKIGAKTSTNEDKKDELPKTKTLMLAPVGLRLNVDNDFVNFCEKKLQNTVVEQDKTIIIKMLEHKIPFKVKQCDPSPSQIIGNIELTIKKCDTRTDMKLTETEINIFMDNEQVKHILSNLVIKEEITELNAVIVWRNFKIHQSNMLVIPKEKKENKTKEKNR